MVRTSQVPALERRVEAQLSSLGLPTLPRGTHDQPTQIAQSSLTVTFFTICNSKVFNVNESPELVIGYSMFRHRIICYAHETNFIVHLHTLESPKIITAPGIWLKVVL